MRQHEHPPAAERLSKKVSIFKNTYATEPIKALPVRYVLDDIKNGKYRKWVDDLRKIFAAEKKSERYTKKKKLSYAVTFGGTFKARNKESLIEHSGLVIGDLDHVADLATIKAKICSDPYTTACFISPSNDGLKLLIAIPYVTSDSEYKAYLEPIRKHYREKHEIDINFPFDGKDISRLCYVSYDPDLYINPEAEVFTEREAPAEETTPAGQGLATDPAPAAVAPGGNGDRYKALAIDNILNLVNQSYPPGRDGSPGNRHYSRRNAAFLAGGYVAGGILAEGEILPPLLDAVKANTDKETPAVKTVMDAFKAGQERPITREIKQAERDAWLTENGYIVTAHKNGRPAAADNLDPDTGAPERVGGRGKTISLFPDDPNVKEYPLTDLGNAERFLDMFGDNVRYNHTSNKWHIWNGKLWAEDKTRKIEQQAKKCVRLMYDQASETNDPTKRKDLAKHAIKSESYKNLQSLLSCARSDQKIAIRTETLDLNSHLFNTLNGTLDLSGKDPVFRDHNKLDNITKIAHVEYNPEAVAPLWVKFIDRIFAGDEKTIRFVQQAVGMSLTGDVSEQVLLFAYGIGKNGKSTFFETLKHLFGEYYQKAPTEMIMAKSYGSTIPNDQARLAGVRFAVASEVEAGRRLAEAVVKDLTGGDTIVARFMRQEYFEFTPTHKLWVYGNHQPNVTNTDEGIWRRLKVIPFTQVIPEHERDKQLAGKLIKELPGILNWALQGFKDWRENGLIESPAITEASQQYRQDMDLTQNFITEYCVVSARAETKVSTLFIQYQNWCNEANERPMKKRTFQKALEEKGFYTAPGAGNVRYWQGIGLKSDREENEKS